MNTKEVGIKTPAEWSVGYCRVCSDPHVLIAGLCHACRATVAMCRCGHDEYRHEYSPWQADCHDCACQQFQP